ncbi:hypothetical protein ACFL13_01885 [Patescibacteria group bacterium]
MVNETLPQQEGPQQPEIITDTSPVVTIRTNYRSIPQEDLEKSVTLEGVPEGAEVENSTETEIPSGVTIQTNQKKRARARTSGGTTRDD